MLHRCPMNRLTTTTLTGLPIFSTFFLLLLHSQMFYAHPTSPFNFEASINTREISQADVGKASSSFSAYDPTYSYRSYRPGTGLNYLYRPYRDYYPKQNSAPAGLYIGDSLGPNSVYSPQSSSVESSYKNFNKALQFIEKEVITNDLKRHQQIQQYENAVTTQRSQDNTNQDQLNAEQRSISRQHNNKPRLLPLPSLDEIKKDEVSVKTPQKQEESRPEPLPTDPIPPPFAPELDPQYERRQYGLGALTLLDQAGPFW